MPGPYWGPGYRSCAWLFTPFEKGVQRLGWYDRAATYAHHLKAIGGDEIVNTRSRQRRDLAGFFDAVPQTGQWFGLGAHGLLRMWLEQQSD